MIINSYRRKLLGYGGLTAVALVGSKFVSLPAFGATAASLAAPSSLLGTPPAPAAFIALSKKLNGYDTIDTLLAARLYAELSRAYPDLDTQIVAIKKRLDAKTEPGPLVLSDDASLNTTYHQILSAWYLGVIGPKLAPRCVAFEGITSYKVVASWVSPPSYCAGQPFFWVNKPV
jgi:hypothetical protein